MSKSIGMRSVVILMLWGGAVAAGETIQWSQEISVPSATGWAGAAVIDGKLYVVSGNPVPQGPPWAYTSLWIYDPSTQSWSSGPSMTYGRYGLGVAVITSPTGQKELYAVGGYMGSAGTSYVERFDPSTDVWVPVAAVDRPMEGAMVAVVNNRLYALGGFSNGSISYSKTSVYDREQDAWVPKAAITRNGAEVPLRRSLTAVWGSKILLFGGSSGPSIDASRYTLIYDTLTDSWSAGADMPRAHAIGATFVWGDLIYLLGSGGTVMDVYSPRTNSWSTAEGYPGAQHPFAAQDGTTVYVLNHDGGPEMWRGVAPEEMVLIPAGAFQMGDQSTPYDGAPDERPVHTVIVEAFRMGRYEVTKDLWDTVWTLATANGYDFSRGGSGKAGGYPAICDNWYDCVKWCNARSQAEGRTPCYYTDSDLLTVYKSGQMDPYVKWNANGYRLPTEAEWEKAARGGAVGKRFPWSDSDYIEHARANYLYWPSHSYDQSATQGYHPLWGGPAGEGLGVVRAQALWDSSTGHCGSRRSSAGRAVRRAIRRLTGRTVTA